MKKTLIVLMLVVILSFITRYLPISDKSNFSNRRHLFIDLPLLALASDFAMYYPSGMLIREHPEKLYDISAYRAYQEYLLDRYGDGELKDDFALPFRCLPFVALVFVPFTYFGFINGYLMYIVFLVLIFIIYSYVLFKAVFSKHSWPVMLAATFLYLPNILSILSGQVASLISLVALLIYVALKKRKDALAGILSGFLLIKVQYLLYYPFLFVLSSNKKDFLKGLVKSVALVFVVSFLVYNRFNMVEYFRFIFTTEQGNFGSSSRLMFSAYSLLNSLFEQNVYRNLSLIINFFLYSMAVLLFLKRSAKKNLNVEFLTMMLVGLVFSVHAYTYELSPLLLGVLILINLVSRLDTPKDKMKVSLMALLVYFLPVCAFFKASNFAAAIYFLITTLLLTDKHLWSARKQ